ncbi:MAG TPA: bifunctional hydroxymethylpyrimidine kinase/phosphomethylpyrimidine kinase [Candidatus Binatia bacterium]|nr:bifunctional hydroxymethylpyrimidine kinase/phosphomethylpyrimidine kinase [Candidatus Binatia bacterium]
MKRAHEKPLRALTVAGSDTSGGAGIQADLATFAALGVFGSSAVTALTVQDTRGVMAVRAVSPALVVRQIEAVLQDVGADAIKTGMLCNRPVVEAVAAALAGARPRNLVIDPVIRSTSGAELLDRRGIGALRKSLLPLARAVTPNLAEASALAAIEVVDIETAAEACRRILDLGPQAVVVTGGHFAGDPIDIVADRHGLRRLHGHRIRMDAHGTGCVFSAALAVHLAAGRAIDEAVRRAKRFVEARLRRAARLGAGRAILDLRQGSASSRPHGA